MKLPPKGFYSTVFNLTVLVTGLGYFIDTFDFFMFLSMRVPSLKELGLSGDALTRTGIIILNCSIFGALIGSFFWGILGDRIGRKKALIGSILIYSLGTGANAFVHDVPLYILARFIIGFGVAGELGLGATLVAETVRTSKRTFALTFFTAMGVLGVAAAAISIEFVTWRTSCLIGGGMGLVLLLLRSILFESRLFEQVAELNIRRGSLGDLFGSWRSVEKYICCILILVPNYLITGVLLNLSPEISKITEVSGLVKANIALALYFTMSALGDLFGAWLSEIFKSRRIVAALFILGNAGLAYLYLQKLNLDLIHFYGLCAFMGLFNLWAISGTIIVEQFPTTLRATASTSGLNFSRGAVIAINLVVLTFKPYGLVNVLLVVTGVIAALGLIAVLRLSESYGRSLAE